MSKQQNPRKISPRTHLGFSVLFLLLAIYAIPRWGSFGLIPLGALPFLFAGPAVLAKFETSSWRRFLGLTRPHLNRHWVWIFGVLILFTGVVVLAFRIGSIADYYAQFNQEGEALTRFFRWTSFALTSCLVTEFFFRGYWLMGWVALGAERGPAVVCVAIGEMAFHFSKPGVEIAGAGILSVFLSLMSLRTKSLWPAVFVHAWVEMSFAVAATGF